MTNSTFSGNSAGGGLAGFGGGIYNGGTLTVTNSTFSGNSAGDGGAGGSIFNGGTATLKGTILANESSGGNCAGTILDDGYNISDDTSCKSSATGSAHNGDSVNPDFNGGLADNGGPTETIALEPTSPAVDAIPFTLCTYPAGTLNPCTNPLSTTTSNQLTCDQRGEPRPDPAGGSNGPCDIGAYEDNSRPACTTLGNALSFALESVGGDVTTGTNASVGKGTTPGSVAGLDVSLGNSSGVGQNAISSSSALVLGTNTSISGACVTGGSSISFGSAARCGSIDTTGTNPLLTTYSESGTDASTFRDDGD